MGVYVFSCDFRICEKFLIHCQNGKAADFEQLCNKFLQSLAFESMEHTHVSRFCYLLVKFFLLWPVKNCVCFLFSNAITNWFSWLWNGGPVWSISDGFAMYFCWHITLGPPYLGHEKWFFTFRCCLSITVILHSFVLHNFFCNFFFWLSLLRRWLNILLNCFCVRIPHNFAVFLRQKRVIIFPSVLMCINIWELMVVTHASNTAVVFVDFFSHINCCQLLSLTS